jgi:hypothetical protein
MADADCGGQANNRQASVDYVHFHLVARRRDCQYSKRRGHDDRGDGGAAKLKTAHFDASLRDHDAVARALAAGDADAAEGAARASWLEESACDVEMVWSICKRGHWSRRRDPGARKSTRRRARRMKLEGECDEIP